MSTCSLFFLLNVYACHCAVVLKKTKNLKRLFSALRTVLEMKPRWSNLSDVPMLNKWLNFSHDWEHDLCIVDVELGEWRKSIKGVDFMLCSCCPAKANLFLLFKFSLFRECTLSLSANSVVYAISVSFKLFFPCYFSKAIPECHPMGELRLENKLYRGTFINLEW